MKKLWLFCAVLYPSYANRSCMRYFCFMLIGEEYGTQKNSLVHKIQKNMCQFQDHFNSVQIK